MQPNYNDSGLTGLLLGAYVYVHVSVCVCVCVCWLGAYVDVSVCVYLSA